MASKYNYQSPIEYGARSQHTATVIMLHGLGDSGDGWSFLPQQIRGNFDHIKFVFPHAPMRPITLNMGMRMPGWYDILSLDDIDEREDEAGLSESVRYVEELIQKEVTAGIPSERVVVAGFSQGGAVALMMLRSQNKLAGIAGLSTYLPLRKQSPVVSPANEKTPVLLCHGNADMVVNYRYGQMTHELLKSTGIDVTFKTYPGMGHSASPAEFVEIAQFLTSVVPPS